MTSPSAIAGKDRPTAPLATDASGNPILASLVEMVSALFYEHRRLTAGRARDLARPAQEHRKIHQAIGARDRGRANAEMDEHLRRAQEAQASEAATGRPH